MVSEISNVGNEVKFNTGLEKQNLMPQNIEAEQNVLGSILYNNEFFDKVSENLDANHFFDPLHKKIFTSCSSACVCSSNCFCHCCTSYISANNSK